MDQRPAAEGSQEEMPPSLQRALSEPDDYTVRLRTGEVVRFTRAERHGAFVILFAAGGAEFSNGLEVRISEIAWCARGPGQLAVESPRPDYDDAAQAAQGVRVPLRIQHADT